MKIAICQPYLNAYGGMEKVLLKIAQHFDAKIYCQDYEPGRTFEEFKELDIEPLNVGANPFFAKKYFQNRPSFSRQMTWAHYAWTFYNAKIPDEFDVLNPHTTPAEWIRNKNAPVVWYNHGIMREVFDQAKTRRSTKGALGASVHWVFSEVFFKTIEKRMLKETEHIFTNSKFTSAQFREHFGVKTEPLYPAADYKTFSCKDYEKTFICITRLSPDKRPHIAIEAFRQFQKKHKGWKLVIAGGMRKGTEENYFNTLKKLSGNGVRVLPNISERQKLYLLSRCYALVFPSVNEPFGIVPLEAMGSKKPVIVMKDSGGPLETVVDGKTGFVVGSAKEMADKMNYLASHPKQNEEMGKNGYKHATKNFTWKNFLSTFEERCKDTAKEYSESK